MSTAGILEHLGGGGEWTASTLDLMPPGAPGSSLEIPTGLLWLPTHLIQAVPSRSLLLASLFLTPGMEVIQSEAQLQGPKGLR